MCTRVVLLVTSAAILSACAASDFSKPVSDFSDVTKKATTSLTEYETTLDQAAVDANVSYAMTHPKALHHPEGDCIQGAKRCRLVIRRDGRKDSPFDPGPVDPRIRAAMGAISNYVDNLKAIVNADTGSAVKSASDAAVADAVNFAKAVDSYNGQRGKRTPPLEPQVTALAAPISGVITFGLSQYAEAVKVRALQRATTAMNAAMPQFMVITGAVADAGLTVKRNALASAFDNADTAFFEAGMAKKEKQGAPDDSSTTPEVPRDKVVALQNAAKLYDESLQLDASKMFADLAVAHDALTKAINDPEVSLAEFSAILQRVADAANKLSDLSKAAQTASAKK